MTLHEDVLSALRRSSQEFAGEMRLAAAIHWYKRGKVSQETAGQVAGLDRTDFLLALARKEKTLSLLTSQTLGENLNAA